MVALLLPCIDRHRSGSEHAALPGFLNECDQAQATGV
jgi:hypothetical protein